MHHIWNYRPQLISDKERVQDVDIALNFDIVRAVCMYIYTSMLSLYAHDTHHAMVNNEW